MNYLLGRYRIPREVLKKVEYALEECKLDAQSFVIIILNPVRDDTCEIEDAVNAYPTKLLFNDDARYIEVENSTHEMVKGREWYMNSVQVKGTKTRVYILYSLLRKDLYGHN